MFRTAQNFRTTVFRNEGLRSGQSNVYIGGSGLGISSGIALILFGVLILIEPRLLAAMVACFFVFTGGAILFVSLVLRSHTRRVQRDVDDLLR